MKNRHEKILITKASGIKVPFNKGKLKSSLMRAGATHEKADEIVTEISAILVEGMSTKKIYKKAFAMLRKHSRPIAARYKLKQAILELGPSGYPFEQFLAELMKHKGYDVKVGEIVQGQCVSHEIDIIAQKNNSHFMIECKFHNRQGYFSDVKVPLYIQSRFIDVKSKWVQLEEHRDKFHQGWVATNTRFSDDATKYGLCVGLHLLSWDYPSKNSLKDWIDELGLHPVTCLTSLSQREKQELLDKKIVLCKMLNENKFLLESIGIRPPRLNRVIEECTSLCKAFNKDPNK